LRHRLPVGTQVCEVKRWFVCRVPSTETRPAPGAQRAAYCWRAIKTFALSNVIKINKELQTSMTHSPARLQ
jgi:hypothetical protein